MPINVTLTADSLDELAEPLRASAKEVGGKFAVTQFPEGFAFENVKGLKSTVQTLRGELDSFKSVAKAFTDAGLTPEQAREAAESLTMRKAGKLQSNEALDEWRKGLEKKFADDAAAQRKELESAETELRENLFRGELSPIVAQMGGSTAMDAILTLAKQHIRVDRDSTTGKRRLVVVDANGAVRSTKKAGSSDPMDPKELFEEMRESRSTKGLFEAKAAGGSGSASQGRGAPPAGNEDGAKLSAREMIQRANAQAAGASG